MTAASDAHRTAYANAFNAGGRARDVTIVRRGDPEIYTVRAIVKSSAPSDLPGANQQVKRQAILLAQSVESSGFPLPIQDGKDQIIWGGTQPKTNVMSNNDAATRSIDDVVIVYVVDLGGP